MSSVRLKAIFYLGDKYVGCYIDVAADRDLPHVFTSVNLNNDPDITPSRCTAYCRGKNYTYAGLQATDKCFCGKSYGSKSLFLSHLWK